ncbi:hypothetical protein [Flavobacterium fluviatile]|uniref:hypothetical protein n=1 Tax=Flavobacterium fluviatile TaxID=1862387 RepID=UPI0013D47896|nr:hypothetical protein [Flavobacterium fluviatile]
MKKILLMLVLSISAGLWAQTPEDDVAVIQDIYGKSKTQLVDDFLHLPESQAAAFKEIYNKYEIERKELGKKKIRIIEDYAENYETLSDEKANELTQANLKNNQDLDKLLSKTFGKARKVIGGKNAAKFVQLEQYLQIIIRSEIQDNIPFIDELDKTKKI